MAIAEFLEDFGSDPAHIIKRGELPAITPPHTIISGNGFLQPADDFRIHGSVAGAGALFKRVFQFRRDADFHLWVIPYVHFRAYLVDKTAIVPP